MELSSTKQTIFFSNYSHHVRADPFKLTNIRSPVAEDLATWLKDIQDELMFQLYEAQDHYKEYADHHCKEQPNFNIGDQAWLLRQNIQKK